MFTCECRHEGWNSYSSKPLVNLVCRTLCWRYGKAKLGLMVITDTTLNRYVLVVSCHVSWLWPVTEDALLPSWSASCCSFIPAGSQWLTLTNLPTLLTSITPHAFVFSFCFYVYLLITLLRDKEGVRLLIVLPHFAYSAHSLLPSILQSCMAVVTRVTTDRTRWMNSSLWMPRWLLVKLESTLLQFILTCNKFAQLASVVDTQ